MNNACGLKNTVNIDDFEEIPKFSKEKEEFSEFLKLREDEVLKGNSDISFYGKSIKISKII